MKPVSPREGAADGVLTGPPGIGDLPFMRLQAGGFLTEWDLTFNERRAIAEGARVLLYVLGSGHPPVALEVEGVTGD